MGSGAADEATALLLELVESLAESRALLLAPQLDRAVDVGRALVAAFLGFLHLGRTRRGSGRRWPLLRLRRGLRVDVEAEVLRLLRERSELRLVQRDRALEVRD